MRSKNALRNLSVSLLYGAFILVLGLIVPRFIILSYGDSVNGLTQTIHRLLSLVNLLQAGAVGASIYQMLKPVAENDYKAQSAVMYASRKFFNRMGALYLAIVMVCAVFFGFYLEEDGLSAIEVFISFCVLAVNGSLYFFFTSQFDIVFSSYQKKYLLTIASFVERTVYYVLLFWVIRGNLHFIYMYAALLSGGVVRVLVNSFFYRRLVGGKIERNPEDKTCRIKDRKYLMLASLGDQGIEAAPTVIISTFVGLAASSVFSIYSMIYLSMKTLVNSFHHAVSAIFGNLVASSEDDKIGDVFDALLYIFMMMGTLLASLCAFLFMDFIGLYADGFTEAVYIQPVLACFIVAYVAVFALKSVVNFVSHSYGMFKLTCKASVSCGIVSVVVCIGSTILFGMPYVMSGVLLYQLSTICVLVWSFRKQIPWFKLRPIWLLRGAIMVILPIVSWILQSMELFSVSGWLSWFITAGIYGLSSAAVLLIYTLIFERKVFFYLIGYVKAIFGSSKNKKTMRG
jgi:hypothetical protein